MSVKVNKFFNFAPAIAWAMTLDALDIIAGWIPIVGEIFDVIQAVIALAVFDDVRMVFGGFTDILFLGPFDIIPTYTATYLWLEYGGNL